jgi:hypothetical protein
MLTGCLRATAPLWAQENPEDLKDKDLERLTPEYQHKVDSYLYGQATERAIEDYEQRHPGKSKADYFREQSQNAKYKQIEQDFSKEVYGLLSSKYAGGWSIEREVSIPVYDPGSPPSVRRIQAHSPYGGDGYLLIELGVLPTQDPTTYSENTINLGYSREDLSKLTRFFQVNDNLLKDVYLRPEGSGMSVGLRGQIDPRLGDSDIVVVTCAHETNGTEVVTIFDLGDSSKTRALHGEMVVIPSNGNSARVGLVLNPLLEKSRRRRVYYYGDELHSVNIRRLVETSGHELLRRSPDRSDNLLDTERRLQRLESRALAEEELTIVNGLPQDSESVKSMGPMVGDIAEWLDFRDKVNDVMDGRKARVVTSREDFITELTRGESDLIVLVAHSTGMYLYLNGERMSLQDLKALPSRNVPSRRPRLAVLVSCESGKPAPKKREWYELFKRQTEPLAQVLVEKGFVDKVIAPDHNIGVDESLTVLQRALNGARAASIFEDWINWAAAKLTLSRFLG